MTTSAVPSTAAGRLGERVRDARNARGWPQQALGKYVGLPTSRIGRIEAGQGLVSIELIELLAAAFDMPPAVLTGWATPDGRLAPAPVSTVPGLRPGLRPAPRGGPTDPAQCPPTLREAIVSAAAAHR